jgi:hypothetical protein
MLNELSVPLTMKIMALGHPLHTAQCLAAVILLQVVLLCTVMGYRIVLPDGMCRQAEPDIPGIYRRAGFVCMCGIFPALTGTEADTSRALLFTQ